MAISSDTLLERLHLKRQVTLWRLLAIGAIIFFLVISIEGRENISPVSGDYIARVNVQDIITDNYGLDKLLKKIDKNDNAKALLVVLDTPGGTAVGGEVLYQRLQKIKENKPVVAVMRTMCTSAGYMAAMGADRVFAMDSTLTGSIGVIMQTAEFTDMADKLGITPITVKSGDNKAAPSNFEEFTKEQRQVIEDVIGNFYDVFIDIVAESRDMEREKVIELSQGGRIYTGRQAADIGLIDEIGGIEEAVIWLEEEKGLDDSLDIRTMKIKKEYDDVFEKFADAMGFTFLTKHRFGLDGLLLIWQPELH